MPWHAAPPPALTLGQHKTATRLKMEACPHGSTHYRLDLKPLLPRSAYKRAGYARSITALHVAKTGTFRVHLRMQGLAGFLPPDAPRANKKAALPWESRLVLVRPIPRQNRMRASTP